MKKFKKTNQFILGLVTLCLSTFLVVSCATEPIENTETVTETPTNLAAKNNPLANKITSQNWADSFSVNGKCYCKSTYDHGVGKIKVGKKTVKQICEAMKKNMKKALKSKGKKIYYNTVQCGHGPAHRERTIKAKGEKHADEVLCPGRVGKGIKCNSKKGPKW